MNRHADGVGRLMTGSVRSLPFKDWPEADHLGWTTACKPGQRLVRGGAAGHLAPVTQADLARRYGYYLDFLDRSGELDLAAEAGTQVTSEPIAPSSPNFRPGSVPSPCRAPSTRCAAPPNA